MGDSRNVHLSRNQVPEVELRHWKQITEKFISVANNTVDTAGEQQHLLVKQTELAHNSMIAFVEGLHEQLIGCISHFVKQIQAFKALQTTAIRTRSENLQTQIGIAETLLSEVNSLLKSDHRSAITCGMTVERCEEFFKTCTDDGSTTDDFSYIEFIPAGRLIVRSEHLGYLRLCAAVPTDVDIVCVSTAQAVCHREFKILIRTNKHNCTNAESYLDVRIVLPDGSSAGEVNLINNNDGSYTAIFIPDKAGMHVLHVRLFGVEVRGSPMNIDVTAWNAGVPGCSAGGSALHLAPLLDTRYPSDVSTGAARHYGIDTMAAVAGTPKKIREDAKSEYHPPPPECIEDFERGISESLMESISKLKVSKDAVTRTIENDDSFSKSSSCYEKSDPKRLKAELESLPPSLNSPSCYSVDEPECNGTEFGVSHSQQSVSASSHLQNLDRWKPSSEWRPPPCRNVEKTRYVSAANDISMPGVDSGNAYAEPTEFSVPIHTSFDNRGSFDAMETFADLSPETCKGFSPPRAESVQMASLSTHILQEYIRKGEKKVKTQFVMQIGKPGDQEDCLFLPIGVTVSRSGDVIICDTRHNSLKMFDSDGSLKRSITAKNDRHFLRPSAVVTNEKGEIFVKDDNCIHVFDANGIALRTIGAGDLHKPYGLSMNQSGHLMLIDITHQWPPSLCIYSQCGSLIHRGPFQPLLNVSPPMGARSKCRFVECVGDAFFVVDLGRSVVYKSDFEGHALHEFGHLGRALGEFNEPSGITSDGNDILLVADSRNNRIQMFSTDGEVHGYVELAQQIFRPSDIYLTDDGLLYVCNYLKHCIKVFRLVPL